MGIIVLRVDIPSHFSSTSQCPKESGKSWNSTCALLEPDRHNNYGERALKELAETFKRHTVTGTHDTAV
jgi:hypothetical protein